MIDKQGLEIVPINLKTANEFVTAFHRHHKATVGHKFSIGLQNSLGELVGVCICGRPVSRYLDDGKTLEINRLCTKGTKNACSKLYSAACKAAFAMGYETVVTYTLESELGASLKASGFSFDGIAGGKEWRGERKPKDENQYPHEMKKRWIKRRQKKC